MSKFLSNRKFFARGYIIEKINFEFPETVEVTCSIPDESFEITNEMIQFAYPAYVIHKADFELVKEKIRQSFFNLSQEEQKVVQTFLRQKLSGAEKTKKEKQLKAVSIKAYEDFKDWYKSILENVKPVRKKIRHTFSTVYRPSILDKKFKDIENMKREDFIVLKGTFGIQIDFDSKKENLPWRYSLTCGKDQADQSKMDCFKSYFKPWS